MTTLSISNQKIKSFSFDPTGNFLFCVTEHELYVLDSHVFRVYGVIHPHSQIPISCMNFSPLWYAFVIIIHSKIFLYSAFTGDLLYEIDSPGGDFCINANFSYNGKYFVAIYNDGYYVLYSVSKIQNEDDNHFNIVLNKICEEKYDRAITSFSYSSGSELIALGFDNGKAIVRSTDPQKSYQWIIQAHKQECVVYVYFNPNNAFEFMTRGMKKGDIKFFSIYQYGMKPPKNDNKSKNFKHQNIKNEIECYRYFYLKNKCKIVTSSFSSDATILFAASSRMLFAFRTSDASIINSLEFERYVEIDSFYEIIPHLVIQYVAIVIAKSSLWIWNCLSNDFRCVVIQDVNDPLFQCGLLYAPNKAMIQTNAGTINFYSCETLQWQQQNHVIDEYHGPWSDEISKLLGEYKLPEIYKTMTIFEQRGLEFYSEGQVGLDIDSESSDFE